MAESRQFATERQASMQNRQKRAAMMSARGDSRRGSAGSDGAGTDLNFQLLENLELQLAKKERELELTAEYGLELSQQNKKLTDQMEALRDQLVRAEAENHALTLQLEAHSDGLADKEEEARQAEEMMRQQLKQQSQQHNKSHVARLEEEVQGLKDTVREMEIERQESVDRENWQRGQVERLKSTIEEMEADNEMLKDELAICSRQLMEANAMGGGRGGDEEMAAELQASKLKCESLKDTVNKLLQRVDALTKELADAREADGGDGPNPNRFVETPRGVRESGHFDDLGAFEEELNLDDLDNNDGNNEAKEEEAKEEEAKEEEAEEMSEEEIERQTNLDKAWDSLSRDEIRLYVQFVNKHFAEDEEEKGKLPLDEHIAPLFDFCRNGVVLCRLLNEGVPNTIDDRVIEREEGDEQSAENLRLCVGSLKSLGCKLDKELKVEQFLAGAQCDLLLSVLWQCIRLSLVKPLNLSVNPELKRLKDADESLEELGLMSAEQLGIKWLNALTKFRTKRFDDNHADCRVLAVLLQVVCDIAPSYLIIPDLRERAGAMLEAFTHKYPDTFPFLNAGTLLDRNPRMIFGFVATVFAINNALETLPELNEDDPSLHTSAATEGDREAEVFVLWLNSLGPDPPVVNLFEDLRDGLVLLKALDKLNPGAVDWKSVAQKRPVPFFKRLENQHYVTKLCKVMDISRDIAGEDLANGHPTPTLALVWQMMNYHIKGMLKSLSMSRKGITDTELVKWAVARVKESGEEQCTITSLRDKTIQNGQFLLLLLNAVKPGCVKTAHIRLGDSNEDHEANAKLAISTARKLGATIFVCVEDIANCRSKMLFMFFAALMAFWQQLQKEKEKAEGNGGVDEHLERVRPVSARFKPLVPVAEVAANAAAMRAPPKINKRASVRALPGKALSKGLEDEVKRMQDEMAQLVQENRRVHAMNQALMKEVGKLRAQVTMRFTAEARHKNLA